MAVMDRPDRRAIGDGPEEQAIRFRQQFRVCIVHLETVLHQMEKLVDRAGGRGALASQLGSDSGEFFRLYNKLHSALKDAKPGTEVKPV